MVSVGPQWFRFIHRVAIKVLIADVFMYRRVACRTGSVVGRHEMVSRRYGVYDFANLDRERNIDTLRYRIFGSKSKIVSGDIVIDRASRVLVFRDHNPGKPPSYILEVKIIAARLRDEFSLKPNSTAEFIAETDNHAVSLCTLFEARHLFNIDSIRVSR